MVHCSLVISGLVSQTEASQPFSSLKTYFLDPFKDKNVIDKSILWKSYICASSSTLCNLVRGINYNYS